MKRLCILMVCFFVLMLTASFAETKTNRPTLINSVPNETVFKFDVNSYTLQPVKGLPGNAVELKALHGSPVLTKGAPEMVKFSTALVIPDNAKMKIEVSDVVFKDIPGVDIAPSKGVINRSVNPATIPYKYGKEYKQDAFFPGNLAELAQSYYIRDNRGQSVLLYPFQYNPVTKVLRVYTQMTVKVYRSGDDVKAPKVHKVGSQNDGEFRNVFARHFLNFNDSKYTPVPDGIGRMLIVSYSSFVSTMSSFVSWKQSCGYTVDIVDYSTIGSSAALKTYVANYYNTNGLTYLLLVGDHAQVPTSSTTAGDSDNNYGYITTPDKYLDIFVGRFSAETTAQLQTQIDRTLWYERDLASTAAYFKKAIGCGTSEGPGHDGEYDYQHVNNMLTDLSNNGYTTYTNHQSGGTTANLSSLINAGAGIILYCGHGYDTGWSCGWTFSSTNVAALTNNYMLPFIFNVSCVTGNFKSITCFCEAWMRSTYNNLPIGAIAIDGSTINQDWIPPMDAQDEMVDLLAAQSKRTFGGVTVNGMFKMQDIDGTSGQNMADTWVCFGDPSLQLRTPENPTGPSGSTENPPVANFVGSPTSGAAPLTVNFTDQSTNNPTSWAWTFGDGGTSTVQNPSHIYTANGNYTVSLTATNAYGSNTMTKTNYIAMGTISYCTSSGTSQASEWIAGVKVGTVTKTSSASAYSDFTATTFSLTRGASVSCTLTPGYTSTRRTEYWKVWVDYNKDGDFADTGENVISRSGKGAQTRTFTVSSTASTGVTRMRVSMGYGAYPSYCGTFSYGEVEDYSANIL